MGFIKDNIANIVIIGIVGIIFIAILIRQIKRFKNHEGCNCGCGGDCNICHDKK